MVSSPGVHKMRFVLSFFPASGKALSRLYSGRRWLKLTLALETISPITVQEEDEGGGLRERNLLLTCDGGFTDVLRHVI